MTPNQSALPTGHRGRRLTRKNMKQVTIAFATILLFAGCGFVYDVRIDGPYRLIAVDVEEEMSVCYSLPGGDAVGRINSTVFAVGKNEEFIVAQRHPNGDRSVVEYYYLIRANDSVYADPTNSVRGPFAKSEFEEATLHLKLPSFSKTLRRLK